MTAALSAETRHALAPLEAALCTLAVKSGNSETSRARFALAYSGGMDSRFLAHAASLLGFEPHLVMATGPQVPPEEEEFGERWAERNGLPFQRIAVDTLSLPLVAISHKRRCYECKREMFGRILHFLEDGLPLCDGTNASDALAYRPGTQAVQELGVLSPLALAGFSKADIYRLASLTGMERPRQKPRPCLLTRLPYGMRPDSQTLREIAAAERAIFLALKAEGLPEADFRIRLVPRGEGLRTELHLIRSEAGRLPPALTARIAPVIAEAAPRLPAPACLVPQESLSGFFDTLQANDIT